ncbi:rifin PIR protein, putative [Plasmodium reichenowi]|uniref:Rifin PIR protein, putative n=1 Tax=Plasmodium reichenowi TaxID=5854 RepID=A0A2P9DSV1_PLARE|nr:rifin PIR protein, putative [Plasmodium reichenowi]
MKVHYINILLFALPLNILDHSKNKPSIKHHTQKIPITRLLCECELYAPANYDNDPQMKEVIQQFKDRTSQRFHEYDDHMKTTRQKCKEQCDKEIQKIILKDKLEKELLDKFATLQTDIQNDAIPTCVCEKSIADKVEKGCLRCAGVLGGGVAPSVGLLGGLGTYAWKPAALEAAIEAALKAGAIAGKAAGEAAGREAVIGALKHYGVHTIFPNIFDSIVKIKHYADVTKFSSQIVAEYNTTCMGSSNNGGMCAKFNIDFGLIDSETGELLGGPPHTEIPKIIDSVVRISKKPADAKIAEVTATKTTEFKAANLAAVESTYTSCQTAIIASIVAIVIIVLIMVIIYKILRYRQKKKMKKKLQYIKLLEE